MRNNKQLLVAPGRRDRETPNTIRHQRRILEVLHPDIAYRSVCDPRDRDKSGMEGKSKPR